MEIFSNSSSKRSSVHLLSAPQKTLIAFIKSVLQKWLQKCPNWQKHYFFQKSMKVYTVRVASRMHSCKNRTESQNLEGSMFGFSASMSLWMPNSDIFFISETCYRRNFQMLKISTLSRTYWSKTPVATETFWPIDSFRFLDRAPKQDWNERTPRNVDTM